MSSHVHIGLYDALREAGASEEKARIAAADIPVGQNLATKEDLLQAIAGVIPVGQNLATKEDLLQAIAGVNDKIAALDRGMAVLKFAYGPIIMALLVKIAFFD